MLLRNAMKKSLCLLLCLLLCLSLPAMAEKDPSALLVDDSLEYTSRIDDLIAGLTLHEKVCQLFFLAPEQFSNNGRINAPGKSFYKAFTRFPVGGVILFSPNIVKSKIKSLNAGMQEAAAGVNGVGLLIGADEEGGSVSRVANKLKLPEKQPAPSLVVSEDHCPNTGLMWILRRWRTYVPKFPGRPLPAAATVTIRKPSPPWSPASSTGSMTAVSFRS